MEDGEEVCGFVRLMIVVLVDRAGFVDWLLDSLVWVQLVLEENNKVGYFSRNLLDKFSIIIHIERVFTYLLLLFILFCYYQVLYFLLCLIKIL